MIRYVITAVLSLAPIPALCASKAVPAVLRERIVAPSPQMSLEDLKVRRRFGVGIGAGGALAVLGAEVDVNLAPEWSVGVGMGTGIDYSTMMARAKYYLLGDWVSPYVSVGVARWWTDGTGARSVSPAVLANRFLPQGTDLRQGFNCYLAYPAGGVQFMHPMGIAFYVEVQYLFRLFSMANGTYAGMGVNWYF